jgi:hypothetical protein
MLWVEEKTDIAIKATRKNILLVSSFDCPTGERLNGLAANVQVLPKAGYFMTSSLATKVK